MSVAHVLPAHDQPVLSDIALRPGEGDSRTTSYPSAHAQSAPRSQSTTTTHHRNYASQGFAPSPSQNESDEDQTLEEYSSIGAVVLSSREPLVGGLDWALIEFEVCNFEACTTLVLLSEQVENTLHSS